MRSGILLSLFLCCTSLSAAELKFDVDSSWKLVQLDEDEEQFYSSYYAFYQEFERISDNEKEELCLMIEPRYTIDCERLSQVEGAIPGDSVLDFVEQLQSCCSQDCISVFSFDESTILIEGCVEDEENGNMLGAGKIFLSPSYMATIAYSYSGGDLSKCDINYWLKRIDQTAEFLDDQELPKAHYVMELDPSLWTEVEDQTKIGRTWAGAHNTKLRCVVAPKNTLSNFENLEDYLKHLQSCYSSSYSLIEYDGNSALFKISGESLSFEKITWTQEYVAAISYESLDLLTEQESKKLMNLLNRVELVEDKA